MKKLVVFVTVLLSGIVLAACTGEEEKNADKKDTVPPVETATIKQGDMVINHTIYGRTAPSETTPILIQAPSEITSLEVENGEKVEEDEAIATIQSPQGTQTLYAETAGQIAQLNATEGSIATNEKPLAVIVDLDELVLNLSVTAESTSLFKEGEAYPVTINETEVEAEITSIGTLPNDTGLYPIEAIINNDKNNFKPGVVAEMNVPENTIADALIVPTEAIVEEGGKTFIYTIKNNEAMEKEITVLETQSNQTAIKGDVKKGDTVVTSGKLTLTDGAKVDVVKEG